MCIIITHVGKNNIIGTNMYRLVVYIHFVIVIATAAGAMYHHVVSS